VPLRAQDPDDTAITYRFLSFGYGREDCGIGITGAYQDPPCIPTDTGSWCSKNPNPLPGSSSLLSIPITPYDYGKHQVGILAVDESGLFDYQTFYVNVTYPVTTSAPDGCISSCSDYDNILYFNSYCSLPPPFNTLSIPFDVQSYCAKWCEVAANPCSGACDFSDLVSNSLFSTGSCRTCVLPIVNSEQINPYRDCSGFTGAYRLDCIARMPNCFLVLENQSNSFVETCYNVANLYMVYTPAIILTS
jgi:hypothetical protein